MSRLTLWVAAAILIILSARQALGQGFDPTTAVAIPSTVLHGTEMENVDLMSGTLTVKIPILHLKGRGIDTDVVATYGSKVWNSVVYPDPYNTTIIQEYFGEGSSLGNGWSIGIPQMVATQTGAIDCANGDCTQEGLLLAQAHRYDGSTFAVASNTFADNTLASTGPLFTYDGSYIKTDSTQQNYYLANGDQIRNTVVLGQNGDYDGVQTVEDTNGNHIDCTYLNIYPSPVIQSCTDTLGRVLTFGSTGLIPSDPSYLFQTSLSYFDSNGNQQTITFNYQSLPIFYPWTSGYPLCGPQYQPTQTGSWCVFNGAGALLLTSIGLPNNTQYTFQYADNGDGTTSGELSKITFPTGGYERFTYTSIYDSDGAVFAGSYRVVNQKFVSPDGTAASEQPWTYNFAGSPVTVTDPQGDVHAEVFSYSTFNFDALSPYTGFPAVQSVPISIQSKDTDAGGNLLQEVDKVPAYDSSAYAINVAPSINANNPRIVQTTTTLGGSSQQSIKALSYSSFGNVSQESDYDWAPSGQTGALLRTTQRTYLHEINPSYAADGVHILDRLQSQSISGLCRSGGPFGSGVCSTSTFTYDNYGGGRLAQGLGSTSAAVIQHDYQNYPTSSLLRGNVTQVVSGPGLNGGTTTKDIAYNDVGDIVAKMDGNGNTTTFDFTDHYSGSFQPSGPTAAFATTVTEPSTNGIQHIYRSQFYLGSSQIAAVCGENFPTGSACSPSLPVPQSDYAWLTYDSMNRATGAYFGDGGSTTIFFQELSLPATVTQTHMINGSESMVTMATYDGLGRKLRSEIYGSDGNQFVDTTYDSLGRVQSVTNPYRSPSAPNDPPTGTTGFAYDGLGRKTLVCNPDNGLIVPCIAGNSYKQWIHSGNITTAYDENRVGSWQYTNDSQDNLTNVIEPGGLQTQYSYDALNNLLTANQFGNSGDTPRIRSFTYDSLARLITSTNPETGTICYGQPGNCSSGYDANGNLLAKTDARGVTISYTYDALSRLTGKSYSPSAIASITPPSTFIYDSNNGTSVPNSIGRLVEEYTGTANAPITQRTIINYDVMGHIKEEQQCITATGCTGTPYDFQYLYDLAGNIVSSNNGYSTTGIGLTYAYDAANRIQTVTSTWDNGATYPGTLFAPPTSGAQYTPAGLGLAQLGVSSNAQQPPYLLARTYDSRMRLTGENDQIPSNGSTPSTGSITILSGDGGGLRICGRVCSYTPFDSGTINVVLDDPISGSPLFTGSVNYSGESAADLTAELASAMTGTDGFGDSPLVSATTSQGIGFDGHGQGTLTLTSLAVGSTTNYGMTVNITDTDDYPYSTSGADMTGGADAHTGGPIYNFALTYQPNGNTQAVNDSVIGNWTYSYDGLNRLQTAQASPNPTSGYAPYGAALLSWTYDSFGNYGQESLSGNTTFTMPQPAGYGYTGHSLQNGVDMGGVITNRIDGDNYDAVGNQLSDPVNGLYTYAYDAENRLYSSGNGATTYLYDAEGRRVAKFNGATLTNQYLLDLGGRQVTELNGNGNWLHSNAYVGGKLLATYDNVGLHFQFSDWLGTRRVQASEGISQIDEACLSLPYGDMLNCSGPGSDATEHHFTGKERDTESGLDYFGARYMASTMGRFMSPDWAVKPEPVPYSKLDDPQSLNLYAYVGNNPLSKADADGHASPCYGCLYTQDQLDRLDIAGSHRPMCICGQEQTSKVPQASGKASINTTVKDGKVHQTDSANVDGRSKWQKFEGFFAGAIGKMGNWSFLHSNAALDGNKGSYEYWNARSSEEIMKSLEPGGEEPLVMKWTGPLSLKIMNGNTRLGILHQRGETVSESLIKPTIEGSPNSTLNSRPTEGEEGLPEGWEGPAEIPIDIP